LESSVLKVESLLLKLEVEILLLCLKELLLHHGRARLLLEKTVFELFDSLLPTLLCGLALGDRVHGLTHQHLDFVRLVAQLLSSALETVLKKLLLLESTPQLCLQSDLHRLLKGGVH
jgi:hypothetical protein